MKNERRRQPGDALTMRIPGNLTGESGFTLVGEYRRMGRIGGTIWNA